MWLVKGLQVGWSSRQIGEKSVLIRTKLPKNADERGWFSFEVGANASNTLVYGNLYWAYSNYLTIRWLGNSK